MREEITIGELAKLMKVSIHQIRYFEEKEVLLPEKIDENGYRLYGLNEIYKLSHILLLRKFNIPVESIKACFNNYTNEDYVKLLNASVEKINEEIKNLIDLRDLTKGIIKNISEGEVSKEKYITRNIKERNLKRLCVMNNKESFSVKQFYQNMKEFNKSFSLHETDIISLYEDTNVYMYIEDNDEKAFDTRHKLIGGEYLCYEFIADNHEDFESQIDKFFQYAKVNNINIKSNLIVIEKSMLSIIYNNGIYYEFQMIIEKE